jgi:hypothetical protein
MYSIVPLTFDDELDMRARIDRDDKDRIVAVLSLLRELRAQLRSDVRSSLIAEVEPTLASPRSPQHPQFIARSVSNE